MLELADEAEAVHAAVDSARAEDGLESDSATAGSPSANWPMNPPNRARVEMPQPAQPAETRRGPGPAPREEPLGVLTDFAGVEDGLRSADDLCDEQERSQATA